MKNSIKNNSKNNVPYSFSVTDVDLNKTRS